MGKRFPALEPFKAWELLFSKVCITGTTCNEKKKDRHEKEEKEEE